MMQQLMTIESLQQAFRCDELNVRRFLLDKLKQAKNDDNNVWISTISEAQLDEMLAALATKSIDDLPLYGIPFAIKDNIDLSLLPTTAACEAYIYQPLESALVVQQLMAAGAIPLGKTNLDQFATGLVGVRSPWGAVKNSFNPKYISGGSSSGSAVAVAKGQVSFALGTDTAGSGRVPAALNNIVGLKATKGLLSCTGVVPACKSLDCVTLLANTVTDLNYLLDISAKLDRSDCYSRANPITNSNASFQPKESFSGLKIGLPAKDQLAFFGDSSAQVLFEENVLRLKELGAEIITINFQPFLEAAKLLYEGPWVAERYAAIEDFFCRDPKQCLPVIEKIIGGATAHSAVSTFKAMYRLQDYKVECDAILAQVDCILTPTTGTTYTIEELEAEPIKLNSNLGYYTNFMNLLDYAAIAVPAGFLDTGLPFGITLFGAAFSDRLLLSTGAQIQAMNNFALGATKAVLPKLSSSIATKPTAGYIDIAVCGAHLSGFPLNHQLIERGGYLVKTCKTSADYRFYALAGGPPFRPGLIRVSEQGVAIEVEIWRIQENTLGSFLYGIGQPLGLGKVQLDDRSWCISFICEGYAIATAQDISQFSGWRAYIKANQSN
ncbi:allophanate hydrolase [Psychromonas antarctica]|uniref:allophanate hydrolase n=1 Tax=Psychromonas antarctica TaxID=67573 RepID=UPI001EE886AB|nr:allophanate hydrolase [Psychromonas antarctica]MCG6202146.1 allophanate hydrolase [Psychromonas antarctica]